MSPSAAPYKILVLAPFAQVPDDSFTPQFTRVDLYSLDGAVKTLGPSLYLTGENLTFAPEKMKDFRPSAILKSHPGLSQAAPKKQRPDNKVDDILSMVEIPGENDASPPAIESIFSDPEFKAMESAWQGLRLLLKQARIKGESRVRVSLSPVSRQSLARVLDHVARLPQQDMPNLILIDLGFDNTAPAISLLEKVIEFAGNMMVPVCLELAPKFLTLDSFRGMNRIPYLNHFLDDMAYAKFRKLKPLAGAGWVMAACNGFAVRPAHNFENRPRFVSPVWAMGTLAAKTVMDRGWPIGFTRYQLTDLALDVNENRGTAAVEARFSEDRIIQFAESGITPLVGPKNKDIAFMPKAVFLNTDPPGFALFFNRVIEALILKKEESCDRADPKEDITQAIRDLFTLSGHAPPRDICVSENKDSLDNRGVYDIGFTPTDTVVSGMENIEFSFAW